ncbi:MAG: FKBP-type peptidyl-prolyl cis-trans isomerase [Bacteroidales bacterium]|nr:FKBP-type peptidyl-prolyl cis-trans isomerase [Bacteroidales bacterium]
MKHTTKLATAMLAASILLAACNSSDLKGFKKTDTGLYYKFEKTDKSGAQPQSGDVLVGEMVFRFDTVELFNNMGNPNRIMMVYENGTFAGDINEGLKMMHVGEHAVFAVEADSVAKYMGPGQMPPFYQEGTGMKLYYDITLQDIVTKDELAEEQANYMEEMQRRQTEEPATIAKYISDNNITAKPNADGLYKIIRKAGNGPRVAAGKHVAINYTGRLTDGTIFDSSVEQDAVAGGIYNPQRPYEPMDYVVGQMQLIKGWEDGIMGEAQGTELTLVIPSALAYGSRGAGELIPPFSPLVFDIQIVSVQ